MAYFCRFSIPQRGVIGVPRNTVATLQRFSKIELRLRIPLFGTPPIQLHRLAGVLRDSQPVTVHESQLALASLVALRGRRSVMLQRPPVPPPRLKRVFGDPIAIVVHVAKVLLSLGIVSLRGPPIPFYRFGLVFCDTMPIVVHVAQDDLRFRIALLGRFRVPCRRLGFILGHSPTVAIDIAQIKFRLKVRLAAAFLSHVSASFMSTGTSLPVP